MLSNTQLVYSPEYPGSHVAQRFQGFRFGSSPVVYIGARLDTRAGQYILLWRDIQQALPGVEQVRCGATVAPFVADDDFTLIYPLRIKYLPGVILNVILEDTGSAPPGYAPPGDDFSGGNLSVVESSDRINVESDRTTWLLDSLYYILKIVVLNVLCWAFTAPGVVYRGKEATVTHLKEAIKAKNPEFKDIGAHQLDNDETPILLGHVSGDKRKLGPTEDIADVFAESSSSSDHYQRCDDAMNNVRDDDDEDDVVDLTMDGSSAERMEA
ncbi:hypothetical protein B0O80DRAFT_533123 [Mortierella sp. GBAus27b]|nr:hypothetical protein B0O80DRAFT_533123 [Mortierella sp. GBAus27b]